MINYFKFILGIVFFILILALQNSFSQRIMVDKAYELMKVGKYEQALGFAESAAKHADTKNDARTWYYKGFINKEILKKNADTSARSVAIADFKKSIAVDSKNEYASDNKAALDWLIGSFQKDGLDAYNAKEYRNAFVNLQNFSKIASKNQLDGEFYFFYANASELSKQNPANTLVLYRNSADKGFADPELFHYAAYLSLKESKNLNAALTWLDEGIRLNPKDTGLILDKVNILMAASKHNEAIPVIEKAIKACPKNLDLYLVYGTALDKVSRKNPSQSSSLFEKRKSAYKTAIALDPNNFSANYNMGIAFFNRAVDLMTEQNYDMDIILLTKVIDDCGMLFKEARPYLEKANMLNPKNKNTLIAMEGMYHYLNESGKKEEVRQKIDKLPK